MNLAHFKQKYPEIERFYFFKKAHTVVNKAKGWILKRVFQENKTHQIFRKTNISYVCVRIWRDLAWFAFLKHPFWNRPFADTLFFILEQNL